MDLTDVAFWDRSFWADHGGELTTLAIYAAGIGAYAVIVFLFYRYMAQRDLRLDRERPPARGFGARVLAGLRFLFLFPLVSLGYAGILVASLFLLSKSMGVDQILLVSMSVVAGVRATSYVNENAAEELARLIPVGLLGVVLVDPGYLSLELTLERFGSIPGALGDITRYFLALVALELALRLVSLVLPRRGGERPRRMTPEAAAPKKGSAPWLKP